MAVWNPWHGCRKISPGCKHCYVYRRDGQYGKDSSIVAKTADFGLGVRRVRSGAYKLQPEDGEVYTCMTSDFFIEEADGWRSEIWGMIRERQDLDFVIITKRIHRFLSCVPGDWGDGYDNVTVYCTCENQEMADQRLPIFLQAPIRHKGIIHEPMLGPVNICQYLEYRQVSHVVCGGESGPGARLCDYGWVLDVRRQCMESRVSFTFKQTGALFQKDGRVYHIARKDQMQQARKAGISVAYPLPSGH